MDADKNYFLSLLVFSVLHCLTTDTWLMKTLGNEQIKIRMKGCGANNASDVMPGFQGEERLHARRCGHPEVVGERQSHRRRLQPGRPNGGSPHAAIHQLLHEPGMCQIKFHCSAF